MSKTIKIPGRIESVATGKVVTGANFILDDTKGKKQDVINEETDAELLRLDQEKQGNLTFDQTPTEGSTNPVTSGGVYAADQMLSQAIEAILLLIPSAASELNKLVDLATMNSSISTATASFKGTYNLVSDLHLTVSATHAQIAAALDALSLGADNNDYAFVQVPNTDTAPTDIAKTERYKFNGENWAYEYDLNNSGFTTAQWNAINSGITSVLVNKLRALPTNAELVAALAGKQNVLTFDDAPTAGSQNPVTSAGIYTRNNEIVGMINALDEAKQDVLTFDSTPTSGSTNPVTSNGVYLAISLVQAAVVALDGRMSTAETKIGNAETKIGNAEMNIVNLQAAYAALTQSDIVVVEGALPSTEQQINTIYRQPDPDHTPPHFYSDYMWNGTAWVLMATYNNAIDDVPTAGSNNLVKSGGVLKGINDLGRKEGFLFSESIERGNYVNINIRKGDTIHFSFSGAPNSGIRYLYPENDLIIPQGSTSIEKTYISRIDIDKVQAVFGDITDFSIEVLNRNYYKDQYDSIERLDGIKIINLTKLDFESGNIQPDGQEVGSEATIRTLKSIPVIELSSVNYSIEDNYRLDFHYDLDGTHYHTNWLTGTGVFNVPLFVHEFRLVVARPAGSSIPMDYDNVTMSLSTENYQYDRSASNGDLDEIRLELLKNGFAEIKSLNRAVSIPYYAKKGSVIQVSFSGSAGTGLNLRDKNGELACEQILIPQGESSVSVEVSPINDVVQAQAAYGNLSNISMRVIGSYYEDHQYDSIERLDGIRNITLTKFDFESGNIQPDGTEVDSSATIRTINSIPVIELSSVNYSIEDNYRLDFHYDLDGTHYHTNWLTGTGVFNVPLFVHEFRLVVARPAGSSIPMDYDNVTMSLSTENYQYVRGASNSDLDEVRLQLLKNGYAEIKSLNRAVSIPYYAKKGSVIQISFSGSAGAGLNLRDKNGELACEQILIPQGESSVNVEVSPINDVVQAQAAYGNLSNISMSIVGRKSELDVLQIPIYAPSPQLPAGSEDDADFDAENLTPGQLYAAYDALIDKLDAPAGAAELSPKYATLNSVIGDDASGNYKLRTYIFTKRNRFAWKHAGRLYAWKNGNTTLYIDSCSPRVGDVLYSDENRTDSGKTVVSYNSYTQAIVLSDNTTYFRHSEDDISPDMYWSNHVFSRTGNTQSSVIGLYTKDYTKVGDANYVDDTHVSFNGKSYERCEAQDFHTDNKATVFIWANEHGPQSDPNEPAIILYRLAKDLCYSCRNNDFISFLKNYCKVVLLPCANPYSMDKWATERRQGRNNYNNVNINRNYDTPGWYILSDSDKGNYAGDQNETQYIMNMCLDFESDIAIDVHCLGYVTENNEGRCHYEGHNPSEGYNNHIKDTILGFGLAYSTYGDAEPDIHASGDDWIYSKGISGGLIEMNAGKYSQSYNGEQHTPIIMELDYTLLLNTLRLWYYGVDPDLDFSKMSIV